MIIFSGIQIVRLQTGSGYVRIDTPRGTVYSSNIESTKRYVWIAERTKPGDLVFEASNPYIYFPFALKNPSAYAQFYQTAYTRPEFVAEAVEDLKKKPTRFILWSNDYNLLMSNVYRETIWGRWQNMSKPNMSRLGPCIWSTANPFRFGRNADQSRNIKILDGN